MANQLAQNEQMYSNDPTKYEVENIEEEATPEEMEAVISKMNGAIEPESAKAPGLDVEGIDMTSQEGAYVGDMEGVSPEMAAMTANPNALV